MKDHHIWYCAMMAWFWSLKGQFSQPKIYGFLVLVFNIRDQIFLGDFNVMNEWHLLLAKEYGCIWKDGHCVCANGGTCSTQGWRNLEMKGKMKEGRMMTHDTLATLGEHVRAFGERLRSCACLVVGRWCISVCVGACGLLVAGPWSLVFGVLITSLKIRYVAEK